MNLFKQTPAAKTPEQEASLVDWFLVDFWPRFGKQTVYALLAIAVVVSAIVWFKSDRVNQQVRENKELGPAFIYLSEDKLDSAETFLSGFVKASHSRLVQDKANLMLGQVFYSKGRYDDAIKTFGLVDLENADQPLLSSGALHGMASSQIQKKEYAQAAENLEKFVARFGRKTANPAERVSGKEVVDLSPVVPNAMWKLALCYRELKDISKAKAIANKLMAIYPESREAYEAKRFLAQIP